MAAVSPQLGLEPRIREAPFGYRLQRRIEETDPYFQMIHAQWGAGLRRVFAELPAPDWK